MFRSNSSRLAILALLHFLVDFYGGLAKPLIQPTLMVHLAVGFGSIVVLLSLADVVVNAVQPLSGALLPRRGIPGLLVLCPLVAAASCMIGLTHSYAAVGGLLAISAMAIGLMHPESLLVAHSLSGSRQGVGVALYISGGFFGFSLGGWVGAAWATQWGLAGFWLLSLPAVGMAGLVAAAGLHRLEGHLDSRMPSHVSHGIPFWVVFCLMSLVATSMSLLAFFITPYLVRRFGEEAQVWGGAELLAFGLAGALSSYVWGFVSEKKRRCATIGWTQLAALPFVWLLIGVDRPWMAPVWGVFAGACIGGIVPVVVVLGRGAPGRASRLRAGMLVGGAFGVGALAAAGAGKVVDLFPAGDAAPLAWTLRSVFALLAAEAALAWALVRRERAVGE